MSRVSIFERYDLWKMRRNIYKNSKIEEMTLRKKKI